MLARGARIGTCSARRTAQLRLMRGDLEMVALRGNVPTRVARNGTAFTTRGTYSIKGGSYTNASSGEPRPLLTDRRKIRLRNNGGGVVRIRP